MGGGGEGKEKVASWRCRKVRVARDRRGMGGGGRRCVEGARFDKDEKAGREG